MPQKPPALRPLTTLIYLLAYGVAIIAQNPVSIPLSSQETYIPNTTYYVLQATDGHMWFATDAGVYRYNGYEFTHYSTANGLPDNEIFRIYEDQFHRIWFLGLNGKPSYYLEDKIYSPDNNSTLAKAQFSKQISGECMDNRGNMYLSTRDGNLARISKENEAYTSFNNDGLIFLYPYGDTVSSIPKEIRFGRFFVPRGCHGFGKTIVAIGLEIFMVGTDNSYRLLTKLPAEASEIISLSLHNEWELFLGTRNGLFILDLKTGEVINHFYTGYSVSSITVDFEGHLWMSTLEKGIFFIPSLNNIIYNTSSGWPADKMLNLFHDTDGRLFVTMVANRYSAINPDGTINHYTFPSSNRVEVANIKRFNDELWIAAKSGLLMIKNGKETYFPIYGTDIWVTDEHVFLAQENVIRFNRNTVFEEIQSILNSPLQSTKKYALLPYRCNMIEAGKDDDIWFATVKGLFVYRNGVVQDFRSENPEMSNFIRAVLYDSVQQTLYAATSNAGILKIKDDKVIDIIDARDGLPYNDCYALTMDQEGLLWIGSNNEVLTLQYDALARPVLENLSHRYHLNAGRIFDIEVIGNLAYLSAEKGLLRFDTKIQTKEAPPKIILEDMLIMDQSVKNIINKTFSYNNNQVRFSYAGVSYINNQLISYLYRLDGYDTDWQKTTSRSLDFKSLPPGNYRFRIKAVNLTGLASEEISIPFTILQPFWQTTMFQILLILFIVAIIVAAWLWRMKLVRQRFDKEKEKIELGKKLAELEYKAFKLQINPHFIFNTLNSIKGYYAENNIVQANEYISKFSKLLRNLLESNEQFTSLDKEIQALQLYLDLMRLRYNTEFSYEIKTAPNLQPSNIGIPPMLLQPFVENSLVHGIQPRSEGGQITISFFTEDGLLHCTIRDNGVGRKASALQSKNKEHKSMAVQIIRDFFTAMNKQQDAESFDLKFMDLERDGEAVGTEVHITMPLMTIL